MTYGDDSTNIPPICACCGMPIYGSRSKWIDGLQYHVDCDGC